ncbi:MAG: hypothetical protein ABI255_04725, partial [Microbacteriaceae bacterium]
MNWTSTDAARRRIVVFGLIAGPALLIISVAVNLTAPLASMRAEFEHMTRTSGLVVVEDLLETIGFMLVLAAFAGSAQALRVRGGALGTWGAALSIVGIVGFALSNAIGFTLAGLAQLPNHDAAFATATALLSGGPMAMVGMVSTVMEVLGQIGMLLVVIGLMRARIVGAWPLVFIIVGAIANVAFGQMLVTLLAYALLLIAG